MRNKDRPRFAVIFLAIAWIMLAGITGAESKEVPKVANEQQRSERLLESNASGREIIVYYFHGTYRCLSCLQIEAWSFDAIQEKFAQELEQGTIIWKTINIDKPENRHLVEAYQVSTQALIIVEMTGKKEKRYKNLGKVWEYLSDQQAFYEYVTHEINKFLTGR
ncbi:MAG: hypothetical protein JRJ17_07025 [Deltaproteobacteria bacterium]|nr:hypothetical protein [Deltaproteobacteria bacterium]